MGLGDVIHSGENAKQLRALEREIESIKQAVKLGKAERAGAALYGKPVGDVGRRGEPKASPRGWSTSYAAR